MDTADVRTNRDLYRFVVELGGARAGDERTLEQYLRTLHALARAHRGRTSLEGSELAALLLDAFDAPVPPLEEDWATRSAAELPPDAYATGEFAAFEEVLLRQVVDLREMRAAGVYRNEYRHFGLSAPSGRRWYNFEPGGFLECAVQGAFRGWHEGEGTSRAHVPGEVMVVTEDGGLEARDPRELEDPEEELGEISWRDLACFLEMGQMYE